MPATGTQAILHIMKRGSIEHYEYLRELYSVEDGTCWTTGPSWALRRDKAPAGAQAGKVTVAKPASAKLTPGPRLRMAAGK